MAFFPHGLPKHRDVGDERRDGQVRHRHTFPATFAACVVTEMVVLVDVFSRKPPEVERVRTGGAARDVGRGNGDGVGGVCEPGPPLEA